jgi:hypothetical protein
MKAAEFDFSKNISFHPDTGMVMFRDSRLVILGANSLGVLRQEVIEELGFEKARSLYLRFGFKSGYTDFLQLKLSQTFDSDEELLLMGPILHSHEGIVKAVPREFHFRRESREFFFTGIWMNSYEAEQHLIHNIPSSQAVCWSLAGYASGWCTAFFGFPLVAVEPRCKGKGDSQCEWLIQPPEAHGRDAKPYIDDLSSVLGLK